tara:strand:+ start:4972 stop:5835 length:864 start_codon:yes stop_codon:yes gene_type:complete
MSELTSKQEAQWRRVIKKGLLVLSENEISQKEEEQKLRNILRNFILEVKGKTDVADSVVHSNTGINVLDDLLKNIIKTIEKYYKNESSSPEERKSFRYHYLINFKNALQPINVNRKASMAAGQETLEEQEGKIELKVKDIDDTDIKEPADQSKFIPARSQDEQEAKEAKEKEENEFVRVDTSNPAVIQGANFAEKAWNDTGTQIMAAYEDLVVPNDADKFYDYGLTNLKLYFDKFEAELGGIGQEPESPDYEKGGGEEAAELPPEPEAGETAEEEDAAEEEEGGAEV